MAIIIAGIMLFFIMYIEKLNFEKREYTELANKKFDTNW